MFETQPPLTATNKKMTRLAGSTMQELRNSRRSTVQNAKLKLAVKSRQPITLRQIEMEEEAAERAE